MTAILEVSDLATYFFTRDGVMKAVDGVSFAIGPGQVLGLVGESGSGKSVTGFSLLKLVDEPGRLVRGSIRFKGRDLLDMDERSMRAVRGRQLAMVFQDPMMTLNPVLSIFQQMNLALQAHGRISRARARARCVEVLDTVGIPDATRRLDSYPYEFSGGMRQRVAIAIALLHEPELIVADEPTTALDVSVQAQILSEMRELVRRIGTSFIWISHDLATVSSLADRIAVMYAGRIVEQGPSSDILRNPRHPYTKGLLDSMPSRTEPGRELPHIPGMIPSLLSLPEGCAYAPRCPFADSQCLVAPEPRALGSIELRCHHPLQVSAS